MAILYPNQKTVRLTLATLLGCTALSVPVVAHAETVAAKTSWAVSRVASATQGSYCTMAQKYANETVLTLAQNTNNEYSLALDFKEEKFKEGQSQNIVLYPQGASPKTYNVVPQSDRTAVILIGNDSDLVKKIASAKNLKIEIGNGSSEYELKQFDAGQKELSNCMDALQTASSQPQSKPDVKTASKASEEISPSAGEPTAEGLLSAMPMPSSEMAVSETVAVDVPVAKPTVNKKLEAQTAVQPKLAYAQEEPVKTDSEIIALREENARLSRVITEQRQTFENKQAAVDDAALNELRQKLETTKADNASLRAELEKASANATAKTDATKLNQDVAKLNQSLKTLQDENQTLKNQIQIYSKAGNAATADAQELSRLQTENRDLQQQITNLKLAKDNSAPSPASASVDADEVAKLHTDMRQLTAQIETLKVENETLKTQAASFQKELEGKQLKMAGGSWDLEQATRRYQESQREIVRLGALLQAKDVQCANEKKDIEYMLFDPAIAEKAQIAMLQSLEDQLKEKNEKLGVAEKELQSTKANVKESSEKDAKIAELQKNVLQTKLELSEKLKETSAAQNDVILSLKAELAQKSQKLTEAETKAQQATTAQLSLEAKDKILANLKSEMDVKNQKLVEAEAKAKQVESAQASLTVQDANLKSLRNELAQKTQQLAEAQSQIQKSQQSQQMLSSGAAQQDATITTLKAQLVQLQSQLAAEQAKSQLIEAKAQTRQSAEQAAALAALQLQVQQGNQKIATLENAVATGKAAMVQAEQVAALSPAAAARPVDDLMPAENNLVQSVSYATPKENVARFKSIQEFSSLLKNAGIAVRGPLQQIEGGDVATYRAYSWKTDSLYGSAEMKQIKNDADFEATVSQYLSRAKSRCAGEFAAVPSPTTATNMNDSQAYEIACVGNNVSSSASVLFTYGNQIATTIAHEGRAEAMDLAIDARDKVSAKIN